MVGAEDESEGIDQEEFRHVILLWTAGSLDNGSMYLTRAYLHEDEFAAAVAEVERRLGPEVASLTYTLDEHYPDGPAAFFLVVLPDELATREKLHKAAPRVSEAVWQEVDPLGQWGVYPYFDYRSVTEHERMKDSVLT